MSPRRWAIVVAAVVLVPAAAWASWRFLRPVEVAVATVQRGTVATQVEGPGTVQARVPLTVSARLTSTIVEVRADVGDAVREGQVLVVLDARDLAARRTAVQRQQESIARQVEAADAAVAKARADLVLASARMRRDADLHAQGFLSVASLDTSTAAHRGAEAALQAAEATSAARRADQRALREEAVVAATQVAYTRIAAPMPGIVTQRLAEPGTTVAPGTPILRLVDPRSLWVTTRIDESVVERVHPGQPATIRLRSGTTLRGKVERIGLQSDAATRELDVQVAFAEPPARIAIDQEAEVRIATGEQAGVVVPAGALTRDRQGRQGVLRVVDGRARFTPVVTGTAFDGRVLVRDGLQPGDEVVAEAAPVRAGMRIAPRAP